MTKQILKFFIALAIATPTAQAFEIAGGIGAIEEGDDRHRPAAIFHLGFNESVYTRIHSYGRKHGPYEEQAHIFSLNYRFPIYGKNSPLTAGIGGSFLSEKITYKATSAAEESDELRKYNFGASFGLGYTLQFKIVYVNFSWDSHVYLAGDSGLFLANARKGIIGFTTGVWIK